MSVDGQAVEADKIVIAIGVAAVLPYLPGLREVGYLTNENVMRLPALPESLIIIGGDLEGMESGQIFQRFSTRVTVLQRRARVLPRENVETARELQAIFREEGVDIRTQATPRQVARRNDEHVVVDAEVAGRSERLEADY